MSSEIVTLVDANDVVVGEASRSEVRRKGLCHRVTYILVFNAAGQLLLQRRTPLKDLFPGAYDASAGGVVQSGESYQVSAARELEEELGVTNTPLANHFDHYFDDGFNRYWGRVYSCRHEGPFTLQASEVESVRFVDLDAIDDDMLDSLTPDTREVLHKWQKDNWKL